MRAAYTDINATMQFQALKLSPEITCLDDAELLFNATENFDADRPWENFRGAWRTRRVDDKWQGSSAGSPTSHTPTIGFAYDRKKQDDPVWAPIFENFAPLAAWLAEKRPDVLRAHLQRPRHARSSSITTRRSRSASATEWPSPTKAAGPRDLPPIKGHPALASHIGHSLMADEFDMSFFQHRPLDHGVFSPLSMLCPHEPDWPVRLVPLQIGVLQFPIPSRAQRCYKLGQALRRAIESYPEDLRVVIVATGGLSHQVHGERAGFNNVRMGRTIPRPDREAIPSSSPR